MGDGSVDGAEVLLAHGIMRAAGVHVRFGNRTRPVLWPDL